MSPAQGFTLAVVLVTLAGVAFGRLPGLPLGRAGIVTLGAAALVAGGVLDVPEAWALIDGEILTLLFALMVVNAALTHAGFFACSPALRWRGRGTRSACSRRSASPRGCCRRFFSTTPWR